MPIQASTNRLFFRFSHALIEPEYLPPDRSRLAARPPFACALSIYLVHNDGARRRGFILCMPRFVVGSLVEGDMWEQECGEDG